MTGAVPTSPRAPVLKRLASMVDLAVHYLADLRRFRRASFMDVAKTRENRQAEIRILAHMLEYGMALSDPRAGFGMDKVRQLVQRVAAYRADYGRDETAEMALAALRAYVSFNRARGAAIVEAEELVAGLEREFGDLESLPPGGTEVVTAASIRQVASMDFLAFMEARHSIRQFTTQPVDRAVVERVVRAAQQTPSSCNRQTCRVYAFHERTSVARVLALHNGNRGFGDQVAGVFVVTVDLRNWNDVGERNQAFVDGGMFAMTLALGLHAEGLGACMLNWSAPRAADRRMRERVGVPEHEVIITLIGFGHMPEALRVPVSRRKPLDRVMTVEPPLAG